MARIVFINQGGGLLFRELVISAAGTLGPVSYYSADRETSEDSSLKLISMPPHRNASAVARLWGWFSFLLVAGVQVLAERGNPLLFIVTNPPFAPILGFIGNKLRGHHYFLLYYDIYPEAFIRFEGIPEQSLITRSMRFLNRLAIKYADGVVTISPRMAKTLSQYYAGHSTRPHIVPTWVDTNRIHPIAKDQNWFARRYDQVDKLTVLYSGNIGRVHDLSVLPEVASRLRERSDIHFMIVGQGAGCKALQTQMHRLQLPNVTFLPFQDEVTLPFLLATGDVGIVALAEGAEGISMPSKTYYTMAAGSAVLGLSASNSDLAALIHMHQCGINIAPGDADRVVCAILSLRDDPSLLHAYRTQARQAAEQHFSRAVCIPMLLALLRPQV